MTLPILFKIVVFALLVVIIFSLASGMFFLVRDKGQSNNTVKSLTVRITLSILLFVLLFVGLVTGMIKPHGIMPEEPPTETEKTLP